VKAVTEPGAGYDGISTFIVDPESDDGFAVTTEEGQDGTQRLADLRDTVHRLPYSGRPVAR